MKNMVSREEKQFTIAAVAAQIQTTQDFVRSVWDKLGFDDFYRNHDTRRLQEDLMNCCLEQYA